MSLHHFLRPRAAALVCALALGPLPGCTTPLDTNAVKQIVDQKLTTVDRNLPLWGIQPGLGTVMIEYNVRMANAYFAAEAGNWDMVAYQLKEMKEIQEVGETTRPARAEALKAFEAAYLEPLVAAATAKDLKAFKEQYTRTVGGCNQCHSQQGFSYVAIKVPTLPETQNVEWKGQ